MNNIQVIKYKKLLEKLKKISNQQNQYNEKNLINFEIKKLKHLICEYETNNMDLYDKFIYIKKNNL